MDMKPGVCLVRVNEYGAVHIQGLKLGQPNEVKFYQVEVVLDHQKIHSGRWPESVAECNWQVARESKSFLWPWLP